MQRQDDFQSHLKCMLYLKNAFMKNKILFERIIVLLMATAITISCKKSNNEVAAKPNGGSYFGAIENASIDQTIKKDGIFFFQSNVINNSPHDTGAGVFYGNFSEAAGST